jgi:hypothetical protein
MNVSAVFVRRCIECQAELDGLACPNDHAHAIAFSEWEVFDTRAGVILATTVQIIVHSKRGAARPSSKVVWTSEADERWPTKVMHGRNAEGYTPDVNGNPTARLRAHRPRRPKPYGRPMSERWADDSGFCTEPGCGKWCRSLDQHREYFHAVTRAFAS